MNSRNDNFDWGGGRIPILHDHSDAKLRLLKAYIKKYLSIVCQGRRIPKFKLTLIDGFAGGGIYQEDKYGSPHIMIDAVEESRHDINKDRKEHVEIDSFFIFVEKNSENAEKLSSTLSDKAINPKHYRLIKNTFNDSYKEILTILKERHPRDGGGVIFFLDQCGYTDVSIKILKDINQYLPNAEVIINIAISNLIEYMNDDQRYKKLLLNFDIKPQLVEEIMDINKENINGKKNIIEAKFSVGLQQATGFRYFSPYFIEPQSNHRGYWLLHMAPHHRAHNAMQDIIWEHGNNIRHYGGNGLNLLQLSYKGKKGRCHGQRDLFGATFNDDAQKWHKDGLKRDLPDLLRKIVPTNDSISVKHLIERTCNETALTVDMYKDVLVDTDGIKLLGPNGGKKRSDNIKMEDTVAPVINLYLDIYNKK